MKADLPLLDSTSSANVLVVLAIGIALAVLGALLLVIAVVIIIRQRKQLKSLRRSRWGRNQSLTSFPMLCRVCLAFDVPSSMEMSLIGI